MHPIAVESTTLATVCYDHARELLQLEFCSRAVYQYFGVPASVHQDLMSAPSKGGYFNQAIRGRYRFFQVPGRQAGAQTSTQSEQAGAAPWHAR